MNLKKLYKKHFRRYLLLLAISISWISFSYGQVGCYALDFDGDNDRVEVIGAPICPQAGSPFTASAWFYLNNLPTGPSSYMAIFSIVNSNSGTLNGSLVVRAETGPTDLRVFAYNNGSINNGPEGIDIDVNVGLNANQWYHVAVVSDGTNVYLYLDGVLEGMDTGLANNCDSDVLVLAKRKFNPPPANNDYLDGRIDDAAFWNTALAPGDINVMANDIPHPPASDFGAPNTLQAYYSMEEATGLVLNDQTANNYNGDLKGDMQEEDWVSNPVVVDCPQNITIKCWESSEPSNTGEPSVTDCPFVVITQLDDEIEQEAGCDQDKIIIRKWSIDDGTMTPIICEQTITIEHIDINLFEVDSPVEVVCEGDDTDISTDITGLPTHPDLDPNVDLEDLELCDVFIMQQADVPLGGTCPIVEQIKREWIIMDLVCQNSITLTQIIKVIDTEKPTITCPDPVTISANNTCTGSLDLDDYPPTASDDCSNVTLSYSSPAGIIDLENVLSDLPIGTTSVTITATDECDNSENCTFDITVVDETPPAMFCETYHTVTLNGNNPLTPTLMPAYVLDDGSSDNCGPVTFLARRMENIDCAGNASGFAEYVPFYCCDVLAGPITVILEATDGNGQTNTCMVFVTVDDKTYPEIMCSDVTINCMDDTDPLNTGYPEYSDNCSATLGDPVDNDSGINSCGVGIIYRTWTATDETGNSTSCTQKIFVENMNPFNQDGLAIDWPEEIVELSSCDAITDPDETGVPEYDEMPVCDEVGKIHYDSELPFGGCKVIIRKWVVYDYCQSASAGDQCDDASNFLNIASWCFTQTIKVIESDDPIINSLCEDVTFPASTVDCMEGAAELTLDATDDCNPDDLVYLWQIDLDDDDNANPEYTGNTNDASGTYPVGTHRIKWKVEDKCGNVSTCEYLFTIIDQEGPYFLTFPIGSTDVDDGPGIEVWASDWVVPNSPNDCNPPVEYVVTVPSLGVGQTEPPITSEASYTFTCADLTGNPQPMSVDVWGMDINGNWSYSIQTIELQDNMAPFCSTPPTFSVSGGIANEEGADVEYVDVMVEGDINDIATTDDDGLFSFNLPSNSNYTVTPELDNNILNGVSTYDLVLISKHILDFEPLTSPYKIIAADVNHSGSVSTLDLVALRRVILFIDDEFPNNTSWRFVDAEFVFPNPADPFVTSFPEVYTINGLTEDEIADFVGVKIGDVNCSATPNDLAGSSENRTANGELIFALADQKLKAGETYQVDFNANDFDQVAGFQFTMSFNQNAIEFNEVIASDLTNINETNFGLHKLNEGFITASWNASQATQTLEDGQVVFSFSFTALEDSKLSDLISINSRFTKAEAYDQHGLMDLSLQFVDENGTIANEQFELLQNQPNPFKDETVVGFYLPESGKAKFKVFDISGRVIKSIVGDFAKGYNEISLNRSELQSSGVLYYQLESADHVASKKMVLLD